MKFLWKQTALRGPGRRRHPGRFRFSTPQRQPGNQRRVRRHHLEQVFKMAVQSCTLDNVAVDYKPGIGSW